MKNKRILVLILGIILIGNFCFAQSLEIEKYVELTGKSKRKGYLGKVLADDAKQQFDLVFVTKERSNLIKFETYQFDYNLNLINNFSDEQEVKAARTKFSWFDFGGEDEEVYSGITAQRNFSGKLVLKKLEIIKLFNWWTGKYQYIKHVLDKEKPTTMDEDGKKRKLFYATHQEISSSGDLLVLALVNRGMLNMFKEGSREYLLLHFNQDLQIVEETPLLFPAPQCLIFSGSANGTDPNGDNDGIFVFAPYGGQGYGKIQDPVPSNYTYVRVAPGGNIIDRFNFKTKCANWAVTDVAILGNDVYIYGPANMDNPEKDYTKSPYPISMDLMATGLTEEIRAASFEELKYSHLQVMKVSDGKLAFITAVSVDDINAKRTKPPGQKKFYDFDGKRFVISDINITASGDIFFNGQDFSGQSGNRVYKDFLMFQFDNTGTFKRFYGIQNTAKAPLIGPKATASPASSAIIESPDGKYLFWQIYFVKEIDEDCSTEESTTLTTITRTTTCYYTPLYQLRAGTIDIASGEISDFRTFGGDDYFLYVDLQESRGKDVPYFFINGEKEIIYLARQRKGGISGNERWGSSIWMGKFNPSK